jgi:small-conductance mechanosensitive channel
LIAAIAVIVLMWFVAGVIAGMVRRKIIRNSTGQDEKNAEKIASLIRDVTYYLLISVGVFAGFKFLDIDLGIILG